MPAAEYGTPAHVAARLTTRPARPDTIQQELRDGKTIVLSRAASLDAEAARALAEADLSALAVIPLPSRGRPLGCLMLGLDTIPTFGEGTLSVARSIATQAATQIEKARLITKLQKAATFRAKLVELAAAISAQADRSAIGGVLCTSGASLFEVTGGNRPPAGFGRLHRAFIPFFAKKDIVWASLRMALSGGTNGATVRPTPAGPRMAPWLFRRSMPIRSVFGRSDHVAGVVTLRQTFVRRCQTLCDMGGRSSRGGAGLARLRPGSAITLRPGDDR